MVDIAPGLTGVASGTQAAVLGIVDRQVDLDAWGEFADDGKRYLAAHLATIRTNRGVTASETLGPMSRSYYTPQGIMGSLSLSMYGAEYERLLRIALGLAAIVP